MEALIVSALLLAGSPALPTEVSEPISLEQVNSAEISQPEANASQKQAACPPGQFPSAFPDVYPTDWAYQAVNRLASRAVQCFDLPAEETLNQ